jgi:hypothetical protein
MLEKLQKQEGKDILQVLNRGKTIEWMPPLRITHIQQDFQVRWKKTFTYTFNERQKAAKARKRKVFKNISIAWTQVQHFSFGG